MNQRGSEAFGLDMPLWNDCYWQFSYVELLVDLVLALPKTYKKIHREEGIEVHH